MAVVEISKLQVRRGQENQTGVPVLDSGEFGWASDTENLYIGLRRIDGGARDANVRILTENDLRNFFSSSSNLTGLNTSSIYTFRDGTGIATTTTVFNPVPAAILEEWSRTVQNKLDDIVNVKDFGAAGDGLNDDSGPIQAAITSLFLSDRWSADLSLSTGTEKVLYFPKGDYRISQRIYIPGKTKIVGEGKDSTFVIQTNNNVSFFASVGNDAQTNPGTADFFPVNTLASPDYIGIEKMTLIHKGSSISSGQPFIQLNCSSHSYVRDVKMVGLYTSTTTVSVTSYAGIELRGLRGADKSQHISIENCEFEKLYTGIISNYDIDHIAIDNNYFYDLDRAVVFCDTPAYTDPISGDTRRFTDYGPRFAKITNNYFDNIFRHGIYVGAGGGITSTMTGTYHVSMNNTFVKVGNIVDHLMTNDTGTSVIKFIPNNNISRNDYFYRYDYELTTVDATTSTFVQLVEGNTAIESDVVRTTRVAANTSATAMLLPITGNPQYVTVKYHMYNFASGGDLVDRRGNLDIYVSSGAVPTISFTDNYNYFTNDASSYSDWITSINSSKRFYQIKLWNKSPTGTGATFNVTNNNVLSTGTYSTVTLVSGGTNYQVGDVITLDGTWFGTSTVFTYSTTTSLNSVYVTVTALTGSAVASGGFTFTGIAATITNTTTFFISTSTNSRAGGAGSALFLDHQLSIMTV